MTDNVTKAIMHCALTPLALVRSCKLSFVPLLLACLTLSTLGVSDDDSENSAPPTRKDAFGNVSSVFAFSFAVFGNFREFHCYSER